MAITTRAEALDRLDQRRRWLTERIKAKQVVGWDVEYDTDERDSLAFILEEVGYLPETSTRSGSTHVRTR